MESKDKHPKTSKKIRYAVVGLGHIAQNAILPAFKHATENSKLTAFVSEDPRKVQELSKLYEVEQSWSYEEYNRCLESGEIDAVYIALPNSMHKEYAIRAASAKVHVLCEKPMAPTVEACNAMLEAAQENGVKFMVAYRLHFDETNMKAVDIAQSGVIGEPKIFSSIFSMQVREGNIRTSKDLGGGPLNDIGVYCINAARYIFRTEPIEAVAFSAKSHDPRFSEVDEMVSGILRFPEDRLATFICSFGAANVSRYQVVGTKGDLVLDPAFDYSEGLKYYLTVNGKTEEHHYPVRDQFASEIVHFSDCILTNREPYAGPEEGLADVYVMNAIRKAAQTGTAVPIEAANPRLRPNMQAVQKHPAVASPELINVAPPQK